MPEVRSSAEYIPLNCSHGHPGDGGLAARKGVTLYVKKYFVGIDVAKLKHTASAIDSDSEAVFSPFGLGNDSWGLTL